MTRRLKVFALIIGVVILAAAPAALAGKGGKGGKLEATIQPMASARVASTTDSAGSMSFAVTRSVADNKNTIWVTNTCWDESGSKVVDRDAAVQWGMWDSLEGWAGEFDTAGDTCKAYVTIRPWQDRVLGDAVIWYSP
jgi:hypothetical protein